MTVLPRADRTPAVPAPRTLAEPPERLDHPGHLAHPDRPDRPVLRVASVPTGHVYVRHLSPEPGAETHGTGDTDSAGHTVPLVHRLPDPLPRGAASDEQRWWPPRVLDPAWVREHDFDLAHLHFGFDDRTPDELAAWVAALRETGRPLVFTVHDLRNPHHEDSAAHDAQLDVLVPAADALVTLTPGAADEVEARWNRRPHVVPHPHVVDTATMGRAEDCRARRRTGAYRIGVHVKSLRANMDPMAVLPTLAAVVEDLPDAVLQVNAHRDLMAAGGGTGSARAAELARFLRTQESAGRLELRVHDYLSDAELWNYLGSLDLSVLPYRFGTHSGWLEACRDLGATVLAPTCGYYAEQGPVLSYPHDEDGCDTTALAAAVREAYAVRPRLHADVAERRGQRAAVARAHDAIYAAVLR